VDCYGTVASQDPFQHKFTAKERDDESRLDFFGARYYGSSLGRFTSADAPFADQKAQAPQSWNLYAYVTNNPLAFVDSNGRGKTKAIKSVIQCPFGKAA
jgi:RHS repeat-associated protein